ncbi:MAG: hypothetical protein ABH969_09920 [Pseudomonadota bacterium]
MPRNKLIKGDLRLLLFYKETIMAKSGIFLKATNKEPYEHLIEIAQE